MSMIEQAHRMCYDEKYDLPQIQRQMRYKETYKGQIRCVEFENLEDKFHLPEAWTFEILIKIKFIDKQGNIVGDKKKLKEALISQGCSEKLANRVYNAISNRGRTHIVATGIIGHINPNIDHRHCEGMHEDNINPPPYQYKNDMCTEMVKTTCERLQISYNKFMQELNKVATELTKEKELEYA